MVYVDTAQYLLAVLGGVLLGVACSLNYVLRGKVTGMSGIMYSVISLNREEIPQKLPIIGGMLFASGVFFDIFGYGSANSSINFVPFGNKQNIVAGTSFVGFAVAGLLVGFGTKLANGCTSGHGLCGLARLSLRSLVAVATFLSLAIAIATINYYLTLGPLSDQALNPIIEINNTASSNAFLAIGVLLPFISFAVARTSSNFSINDFLKDQAVLYFVGIIFGVGLMVSGMTKRLKIKGFLQIGAEWDPSLLFVLGAGVGVNLLTFNLATRYREQSIMSGGKFPSAMTIIDWKLIVGAALFGLGWGIGHLCPGPFFMLFSVFSIQIQVVWGICCIVGMLLASWVSQLIDKKKAATAQSPEADSIQDARREQLNQVVPQESSDVIEKPVLQSVDKMAGLDSLVVVSQVPLQMELVAVRQRQDRQTIPVSGISFDMLT